MKSILFGANAKAEEILEENIELLHKTSKILLERETLDAIEIEMLMKGEELPPINLSKLNAIKSMKIKNNQNVTNDDEKVTINSDNNTDDVSSENKNN